MLRKEKVSSVGLFNDSERKENIKVVSLTSSVVITTYNGEKHILEQLDSLRNQSMKPNEVIILDDASIDNTVDIIEHYIHQYDLMSWRIICNPINVGWKKNFLTGFRLAGGDVIFPCDQDDIWHIDKIESMMRIMMANNNISVLAGQAHKFFEREKKEGLSEILDRLDDDKNKNTENVFQPGFDESFFWREPGCVLAIRRSFFQKYDTQVIDTYAHDAIIPYYAKILGEYYVYDRSVIEWRRHSDSSSKTSIMTRQKRIKELEYDRSMCDILLDFADKENIDPTIIDHIRNVSEWNRLRIELVRDKKIISGLYLIRYFKCYLRKRRYITDFVYSIRG